MGPVLLIKALLSQPPTWHLLAGALHLQKCSVHWELPRMPIHGLELAQKYHSTRWSCVRTRVCRSGACHSHTGRMLPAPPVTYFTAGQHYLLLHTRAPQATPAPHMPPKRAAPSLNQVWPAPSCLQPAPSALPPRPPSPPQSPPPARRPLCQA